MKTKEIINFFLFLYVLIQIGYTISFGNFSFPSIFILISCLALWIVYYFYPRVFKNKLDIPPKQMLYFLLMFSIIFSIIIFKPTLQQGGIPFRPPNFNEIVSIMHILLVFTLFIGVFFCHFKKKLLPFILLVILATALRIIFIYVSPYPRIDTYDILSLGSSGLVKGMNPYQMTFIKINEPNYIGVAPDYFSYTPGILFFTVPAVLLLKDQRILFAIANTLTAIIWYIILKNKEHKENKQEAYSEIIPLIFLFNPSSYYIIIRGWTDPIVILMLTIISLALLRKWSNLLVIILLGITATIKQTMLFIPLFFIKYWVHPKINLFSVSMTIFSIIIPFLIWSPNDFLQDSVLFHIKNPIRHEALIINNLYYSFTHMDIPSILLLSVTFFVGMLTIKKQGKSPAEIFLTMGVWYLTFFLFNTKQAFVNYYYFISGLILLYLTIKLASEKQL